MTGFLLGIGLAYCCLTYYFNRRCFIAMLNKRDPIAGRVTSGLLFFFAPTLVPVMILVLCLMALLVRRD